MLALALIAVSVIPQPDGVLRDRCDLVEVNHLYDECGREVFTQAIFWDWSENESRYNVRAWRLVKSPSQMPQRDWGGRGYSAIWQDGEVTRRIYAEATRETFTQYDPELVEREFLPKEKRRELRPNQRKR